MTPEELQALPDEELLKLHARMLTAYSEARATPDGHEYMPWIQADLAQINREMERRGKWGSGQSEHA